MPPEIRTKKQLAAEAVTLAQSFDCRKYKSNIYLPVDAVTKNWQVPPSTERRAWMPLSNELLESIVLEQFNTLFATDQEFRDYRRMLMSVATPVTEPEPGLLVLTHDGLKVLQNDGLLHVPNGEFIPNMIPIKLNENQEDKNFVHSVIVEWLNSEEEARHLLRHLATGLAPEWSAVRYLLLIGSGRNGKSLLMQMMQGLFGKDNVSYVSRQQMSSGSTVVPSLNGKLLNIIFDGEATYLKDSGNEKSLIAGEEVGIRVLYKGDLTMVQTNALFIEGLNREPKSSDKSSALQERLVRFWFKNTYEDDLMFKERMLSQEILGALLSLLIDNYVRKEQKAVMLAPTRSTRELRLEHQVDNSLAMQFLDHLVQEGRHDELLGMEFKKFAEEFRTWRLRDGDVHSSWSEANIRNLFKPVLEFDRKSIRQGSKVAKVPFVSGFSRDAQQFIEYRTHEEKENSDAVVGD